jgi:hypothetical protein
VPIAWRDVEAVEEEFQWAACDRHIDWCREHGLKVCAGPLLQLDGPGLPDWVYLWEDDFDNFFAAASQFIQAVVKRYQGKVDLWVCAARANTARVLDMSEEDNLRLAAGALQLVRTLDPNTPRAISIDQPWGEYMGRREVDSSPLHFADALVRAGLDLKAILLEMNFNCLSGASLPRTEVELSRQLDYWGMLGLPLMVALSIPSADGEDPAAQVAGNVPAGSWSPEIQQAWAARYIPLMLAKPGIQGVFWNQLSDSQPHDFPHAGWIDDRGQIKPVLKTLAAIQAACLGPR